MSSTPSIQSKTFTTVNTACCIIPPEDVWPQIYSDSSAERVLDYENNSSGWPAHINFEFTNAKTKLKQVLKMNSISPFEIELSEFDVFEHTFNSIVYMKPKVVSEGQHGQDLLCVIHDLIGKTFRIQDTHEYIPHISVLYVKTDDMLKRKREFEQRLTAPIRFTVDKLHFIATSKENGKMYSKCFINLD